MSIGITGKFKPDGNFPLMDAVDVMMANGATVEESFAQAVQLLNEVVLPRLLPTTTGKDNGKFLQSVNGAWSAVDVTPLMTELIKMVVNGMFVPMSQAEYDALVAAGTVDESKYYMIAG
jgi:hypothetical protein